MTRKKKSSFSKELSKWTVVLFSILVSNVVMAQTKVELRIDPTVAHGGVVSDFFEEVNFIPLETTKKSTFNNIDQMEVTDDFFVILDKESNSILIFRKNGQFNARIEATRYGYSKARPFYTFFINYNDLSINVPSPKYRNLLIKFDLDGELITDSLSFPLPTQNVFIFSDSTIATLDYMVDSRLDDSITHELRLYKKEEVTSEEFEYNRKSSALSSADILYNSHSDFYRQGENENVFFVRPYNYNIYLLTSRKLSEKFEILLPKFYSLPEGFIRDTTLTNRRIPYLQNNPNLIYGLTNVFVFNEFLFVKLKSYSSKHSYSLLYDIGSNRYYDLSKISPDSVSSFLFISDSNLGGVSFNNFNFGCRDQTHIYTFYSARRFIDQFQTNTVKIDEFIPPELNAYLKQASINDNHVVVELKPKGTLH